MRRLIDQMGLRISMSNSYWESQPDLQPGAFVISNMLRVNFTCFQKNEAPFRECNPKKPGIGKDESHGKLALVGKKRKKKNSPNVRSVGLDAGRKTAYSKGKRHRMTDWWRAGALQWRLVVYFRSAPLKVVPEPCHRLLGYAIGVEPGPVPVEDGEFVSAHDIGIWL